MNPWNLTPQMERAMDAYVAEGGTKAAADSMGLSPSTIDVYLHQARQRMGAKTRLLALLTWDRFRRVEEPRL